MEKKGLKRTKRIATFYRSRLWKIKIMLTGALRPSLSLINAKTIAMQGVIPQSTTIYWPAETMMMKTSSSRWRTANSKKLTKEWKCGTILASKEWWPPSLKSSMNRRSSTSTSKPFSLLKTTSSMPSSHHKCNDRQRLSRPSPSLMPASGCHTLR